MTEQQIHIDIVGYLRAVLPSGSVIHHSVNEGNRGGRKGMLDGARRAAMGMMPGFPDILLLINGEAFCIEIKGPKGRLSQAQRAFRDLMDDQCIPYEVARSVDDVRALLSRWAIETREIEQ